MVRRKILIASLSVILASGSALIAQDKPQGDGGVPFDVAAWSDAGQPDSAEAPELSWSYYSVVGMQLQPRVSSTTFGYDFNGCLHIAGGTDNRLTFPLLLPHGSEVHYLRIYYDDTNASVNLTAWLTRYSPGQSSVDLTSIDSAGSAGYGTQLSVDVAHVFDSSFNYSLIVATNTTDATAQICGLRVAYYAP